jgi:hypothetical protein
MTNTFNWTFNDYASRLRRLEVILPKPKRRYRNGADAAMAKRLGARIPSDEEVMYFSQNHHYANEDFCAELDRVHSGVLEGCDQIIDLSDYYDLLDSINSQEV